MALRLIVGSALRPVVNNQIRNSSALSVKEVLASQPHTEVTTLKNGFRVSTEENGRATATVGVWIETGSRYENEQNNGVAHFLERLIHKGTGKRASAALESELDAIGAKLQSSTDRDQTAVYVQAASQDVEKVVDILADVLRNSKLDTSAIEAERSALLEQLDESEQYFQAVLFDNLHASAFQGTPLAKSPLGSTASLKVIGAQQLKEWQEDHYRPVRMVLSAVGGGVSNVAQLSEKYFGDLSNEYPRKVPEASGIRFTGSEYRYRNDNIPHMYAAFAVEGVPYGHKDALALQLANQFIGQWDVTHATSRTAPSRLVQKISHDHGLHLLQHFNVNYKDTGLFGIYFVANGDDINDTHGIMKSVAHEWKHLASATTEDEANLARNQYRTALYQNLETNTQKAAFNAKEILYTGNVRSLSEVEEQISKTDHTAIREAVSRHVYDRDLAAAGVGRTEAFPPYAFVRAGMSWWRLMTSKGIEIYRTLKKSLSKTETPSLSTNIRTWPHPPEVLLNGQVEHVARFYGATAVSDARGRQIVAEALHAINFKRDLRRSEVSHSNSKPQKVSINVSVKCVAIVDAKTSSTLYSYPLSQITYVYVDPTDPKLFSFIAASSARRFECYLFTSSEKLVQDLASTIKEAIDLAYKNLLEENRDALLAKRRELEFRKQIIEMQAEIKLLRDKVIYYEKMVPAGRHFHANPSTSPPKVPSTPIPQGPPSNLKSVYATPRSLDEETVEKSLKEKAAAPSTSVPASNDYSTGPTSSACPPPALPPPRAPAIAPPPPIAPRRNLPQASGSTVDVGRRLENLRLDVFEDLFDDSFDPRAEENKRISSNGQYDPFGDDFLKDVLGVGDKAARNTAATLDDPSLTVADIQKMIDSVDKRLQEADMERPVERRNSQVAGPSEKIPSPLADESDYATPSGLLNPKTIG
ncbi:unnamed protein product [Caenorhabditis auriculariae]|uniref:PID domain-containing protein n=1 Tax=Caenorhabditis auriculariae TaxID=2777116 RepID=A0A8S1HN31_9PELO|nr:unnamed protein product [Caenorhabditis auriculariae]